MAFIRIDNTLINTDHIVSIVPFSWKDDCAITLINKTEPRIFNVSINDVEHALMIGNVPVIFIEHPKT